MHEIQDNIALVDKAMFEVKEHPMCGRFEEDSTHYRVLYPEGMYPNGVQCSKGIGKKRALQRMLQAMERHWKQNGIIGE